jgi:hypothetical protein
MNALQVTFLYFEGCSSHEAALERLRQVIAAEGVQAEIQVTQVETDEQAHRLHFTGSPTILIDGQDIDPLPPDAYPALTCRAYQLEDGRISPLPSSDMIRRALQLHKT